MSKADEMFEELGYRKANKHVAYIKEDEYILSILKGESQVTVK